MLDLNSSNLTEYLHNNEEKQHPELPEQPLNIKQDVEDDVRMLAVSSGDTDSTEKLQDSKESDGAWLNIADFREIIKKEQDDLKKIQDSINDLIRVQCQVNERIDEVELAIGNLELNLSAPKSDAAIITDAARILINDIREFLKK